MKASRPSNSQRTLEVRADVETRVQQHRQRHLPAWLRKRSIQRFLALTPALILALGVLAATIDSRYGAMLVLILATLCGSACTILLRRITQMVDTAPLALLDEREIAQRHHGHQRAFLWVLILLGTLCALAVVDYATADTFQFFSDVGWICLLLVAFCAASMLPAAALAWSWEAPQDLDDTDD